MQPWATIYAIRNTRYAILANRLLSIVLYIYREPSTNQLIFMQNKPNLLDAQINVSSILTKDYENIANWTLGENKPNSNPIKPNFRKAQMNVNSLITKDYRKYDDFAVQQNKPNSNPISVKAKMNANVFVTKDYENKTTFRLQKNKPNSNPISSKAKMSANVFITKDYENDTAFRPKKTNPIKPNFKAFCKKGGILMPSQEVRSFIKKSTVVFRCSSKLPSEQGVFAPDLKLWV